VDKRGERERGEGKKRVIRKDRRTEWDSRKKGENKVNE